MLWCAVYILGVFLAMYADGLEFVICYSKFMLMYDEGLEAG
jgi:hypothetical protein